MATLRTSDVFVPGGLPRHTYVPREARNLEQRLAAAKDNLCKLVALDRNHEVREDGLGFTSVSKGGRHLGRWRHCKRGRRFVEFHSRGNQRIHRGEQGSVEGGHLDYWRRCRRNGRAPAFCTCRSEVVGRAIPNPRWFANGIEIVKSKVSSDCSAEEERGGRLLLTISITLSDHSKATL